MNYELAYRLGWHPWEDAAEDPPFVEKLSELFSRDENGGGPPYARALDLGCGSGIWGVELARRGWQVTGVDNAARALARARDRVREAGVEMRLVDHDVTDLRSAGIGSGFRLVVDSGTFHGLTPAERTAMGREVDAIAAADATVLLLVWEPKRRGPLPSGATRAEIEAAFPGWAVASVEESYFQAPKPIELLLKPDERWYRLRRAAAGS